MVDRKPSRIPWSFSGLFRSRSHSQSSKPQVQQQVDDTTAIQRANQAALQQNKRLNTSTKKNVSSRVFPRTSPVGNHDQTEASTHEDRYGLLAESDVSGLESKAKIAKIPDHTYTATDSPDTKVSGAAYSHAWSELSEEEKAHLSREDSIKTLFEQLDQTDQQDQANSWIRKGKLASGLEFTITICEYVDLVATWIPVPSLGAALGLFKGIVGIFVGICGAHNDLTNNIRTFLHHIPVIERCDSVDWLDKGSRDIYNILVNCFLELLRFYSSVMSFFQKDTWIRNVQLAFHSKIPDIVKEFNKHANSLSELTNMETTVTVAKIWDLAVDEFVTENLYKRYHTRSRNVDDHHRSDEACQWIISDKFFEAWAYGVPSILTVWGVVGCGKTATASYVAKYLREEETKPPVLAYYCMANQQQQGDQLQLILCSMTYQLLQKKPELKQEFIDWFKKRHATTQDKPSDVPAILWEFLSRALYGLKKQQVFIVLDGLDECEQVARRDLLVLLMDVMRNGAPIKVFISSRRTSKDDTLEIFQGFETTEADPAINPASQKRLFQIDVERTDLENRDKILATHLVSMHLGRNFKTEDREKAIDLLAAQAKGSAIWLALAMPLLDKAKNERGLKRSLEFLATSPKFVDLYLTLFKEIDTGNFFNMEIVEGALETLAVARRSLTVDELCRAALIGVDGCGKSLADLNEEVDVLDLVRPFLAIPNEPAHGGDLRVDLVHHSLLELLLRAQPSKWQGMAEKPTRITENEKSQRKCTLNEQLMGRCVKYLLLKDLLEDNTSASGSEEDRDKSPDSDPQDSQIDDEEESYFGIDGIFVEPEVQKRVETRALISEFHFYDYAASHWAYHFAACEQTASEELKDKANMLLHIAVSGCTDWVSFLRHEKEAGEEAFPSSSEPATLAAYFGLPETLTNILVAGGLSKVPLQTRNEALFWAAHENHESIIKLLLENGAGANQDEYPALTVAARRGHLNCVQALLSDPRIDVNLKATGARQGRTALSFAAGSGQADICSILLRRVDCRPDEASFKGMTPLFYAVLAEQLPVVTMLTALPSSRVDVNHRDKGGCTALLHAAKSGTIASLKQLLHTEGVDVNQADNDGKSPLLWAAYGGHASCVNALMQHSHINGAHVCKDEKNAIHYACENGKHEALKCLLKHRCPGIDDPDVNGWTPLMWAIQNSSGCVQLLLATDQVEVERSDKQGKTALSLAVQWGHSVDVVRALLHHDANPETTDNDGQTPLNVAMKKGRPEDFAMADEIVSWMNKKRTESQPRVQDT